MPYFSDCSRKRFPENVFFDDAVNFSHFPNSAEKYNIEGRASGNLNDFYEEISLALKFPSYFGRNLDALEECLFDFMIDLPSVKVIILNNFNCILEEESPSVRFSVFEIFVGSIERASENSIESYILLAK